MLELPPEHRRYDLDPDTVATMDIVPRVRRLMEDDVRTREMGKWTPYTWRFSVEACRHHPTKPEVTYFRQQGRSTSRYGFGTAVRCDDCQTEHKAHRAATVARWRANHPERAAELNREAVRRFRAKASATPQDLVE